MASYRDINQEEDDGLAPQPPTPGAPARASAAPASGASSSPKTKSAPDRFVSFDQFYNANVGSANQLAGKVADTVQTQAAGAQSGLNAVGDQFAQQVQQAGLAAPKITNANGTHTSTDGVYAGPTDITDAAGYEDARKDAVNAGRNVRQLRSTEGIQALLPSKNANQTANIFNAALAQRAGGDRFQNLWNQFQNVGSLPDTLQTNAAPLVNAAQSSIKARNEESRAQATRLTEEAKKEEARQREQARLDAEAQYAFDNRYEDFDNYYGGNVRGMN